MRHSRRPLSIFTRCGLFAADVCTIGAGPLCQECRKAREAWKPQPPIIGRLGNVLCFEFRKASVRAWKANARTVRI